jgi:Holliday junction resolvase RusA-like endonuclease
LIKILINTRPKPQQRHRHNGKFQYDPSAKDKKEFLLQSMKYAPKTPTLKNIEMYLTFCYKRPRNHYTSKNKVLKLKPDAPQHRSSTPDLDNLEKFVLDCYEGTFYKNDSQVVRLTSEKVFGEQDYVYIKIIYTKK